MFKDTTDGTTHHDNDACKKCEKCKHHIVEGRMCGCPYVFTPQQSNFYQVGKIIKCGHCGNFAVPIDGKKCECICHEKCGCFVDVITENCKIHKDEKYNAYDKCLLCNRPYDNQSSQSAKMVKKSDVIEMIEEIIKKKEQVHGYQPYGHISGDQEPHQKIIFFNGWDDGRNLMKIDLKNLLDKINI